MKLHYIQAFFQAQGRTFHAENWNPPGLPVWIKQGTDFYRFPLNGLMVTLIVPSDDFVFDQVANVYRVFTHTLPNFPAIVLADHLPAKARGPLVRLGIPHVVDEHSIFAPDFRSGLQSSRRIFLLIISSSPPSRSPNSKCDWRRRMEPSHETRGRNHRSQTL